jgi:hypothetical protein
VTYYTSDGQPLETIPFADDPISTLRARLDPAADRPKAAAYKVVWDPGFYIGFGMIKGHEGKRTIYYNRDNVAIAFDAGLNIDGAKQLRSDLSLQTSSCGCIKMIQRCWRARYRKHRKEKSS